MTIGLGKLVTLLKQLYQRCGICIVCHTSKFVLFIALKCSSDNDHFYNSFCYNYMIVSVFNFGHLKKNQTKNRKIENGGFPGIISDASMVFSLHSA